MLVVSGTGSNWLETISNREMLSGVMAGFTPIEAINSFVRHPYLLALAYLSYAIAITRWNLSFPLLVVGTSLSLTVIYLLGSSGSESGRIRTEIILLGKYSLFAYISQVAILQILSAGFHRINLGYAQFVLSFFAAFVLTIAGVAAADRARIRMAGVDRLYRMIFA